MGEEIKEKKNHGGLKFFLGWLTGILTFVIAIVVAGVILVQIYEPKIGTAVEQYLENYAGESASGSLHFDITLDFKTITYDKDGETYNLHFAGLAHPVSDTVTHTISLNATVNADSYSKLEKNVKTGGSDSKNLEENYGLKGIIYAALVFNDSTTEPQTVTYNGATVPWTKTSNSSSSSGLF